MGKLDDKVVIVTGAASGMGKAMVELFAAEGAMVLAADYNGEGAAEVSNALNNQGWRTISSQTDVSNREDVETMIDKAIEEFGKLDILVNNAGIMDGFEPVGEITDERWDRIFAVNTKSVMWSMRKTINHWLENNQAGVIINTISTGGINGAHAGVAYGASKHAVTALTRNSAYMYAEKGIRVNGIAPGAVATNIGASMTNMSELGASRTQKAHSVSPGTGEPEDIANVALFLASEESSFVNGTIIVADGGWTAAF